MWKEYLKLALFLAQRLVLVPAPRRESCSKLRCDAKDISAFGMRLACVFSDTIFADSHLDRVRSAMHISHSQFRLSAPPSTHPYPTMMKSALFAALVASASAFAPAPVAQTSSTSLAAFESELGVQPPLGFWDPLGILDGADQAKFDRLRYVEVKHGRVAMLAFLGQIVTRNGQHWDGAIDKSGDLYSSFGNGLAALFGPNASESPDVPSSPRALPSRRLASRWAGRVADAAAASVPPYVLGHYLVRRRHALGRDLVRVDAPSATASSAVGESSVTASSAVDAATALSAVDDTLATSAVDASAAAARLFATCHRPLTIPFSLSSRQSRATA